VLCVVGRCCRRASSSTGIEACGGIRVESELNPPGELEFLSSA
jgi:hypothetical protein